MPSFVAGQSKLARSGGSATPTVAFDNNVTAGNAVAVFIRWTGTATLNSVADSLGNSYTLAGAGHTEGVSSNRARWAYFVNLPSGGACTITATFSAAPGETDLGIHENTGSELVLDTSVLVSLGDLGTGTDAWTTGTTTIADNAIINAWAADEGYGSTWSTGTNYTTRHNELEVASETREITTGGSFAATFTNNNGFMDAFVGLLSFKESGAAASILRQMMNYHGG